MEIKILYEDEYILALDKPSGLLVHGDGRGKEPTLVDWLNENYPDLKEVGEPLNIVRGKEPIKRLVVSVVERPGIVHRLDRETSGVIIIAKTQEAFEFLKKQFQERKVEKIYHAIVWGSFSAEKMEGVIDKPIGRSAGDFRQWSAEHGAKGELREAVTEYKALGQTQKNNPLNPPYIKGGTEEKNKNAFSTISYLEVRPKTGRTHQIRVHLKSIGHSVVGDKLYGANPKSKIRNPKQKKKDEIKQNRLMLHAVSVKLELPNHTHITIESPLPEEFENAKNLLKTTQN